MFDVLLDQPEPLATSDVRALLTYVHALEEGSPVRERIASALRGRARTMYVSGADALIAKGKERGRRLGLDEGRRLGQAKGLAQAVLAVLAHRSLRVPAALRRRVLACRDEARLRRWLERAITATSTAEVFHDV
jgi:hypothetical protein